MDVLVVDDDAELRSLVAGRLAAAGHRVHEVGTTEAAKAWLFANHADLAILDVRLPDGSGFDLLRDIRAHDDDLYIVMLTSAGSERDRLEGLTAGADDYVVKPFSVRELAARVAVAARRLQPKPVARTVAGPLAIDSAKREVTVNGRTVELTRLEFDLLAFLAARPARVFSRDELLRMVWGSSSGWQLPSTVTEHMRRLRQKFAAAADFELPITAVRGVGYRLDLDADPVESPAAAGTDEAIVVHVGGRIAYATPGAARLVAAISAEELLDRSIYDFVSESSVELARQREEVTEAGGWPRPQVLRLRRVDGTEVDVLVSSTSSTWAGSPARQTTLTELPSESDVGAG